MPALLYRTKMPKPDDPEILSRMAEATLAGHPLDTAGRLSGLGSSVAQDWYKQGSEALAAELGTEPSVLGSHAVFADCVNLASAQMVDAKLGVINEATLGKGGWVPAMTLLERRRPQDFGRFQRIEVESKSLVINLTGTLPPGAAEALHLLAEAETKRLPSPKPESP